MVLGLVWNALCGWDRSPGGWHRLVPSPAGGRLELRRERRAEREPRQLHPHGSERPQRLPLGPRASLDRQGEEP